VTFSYDKDADVLYITFERLPNSEVLYTENENGDILRLDKRRRQVVGCTIPHFLKRTAMGKVEIPEIGAVPFNDILAHLAL